MTQPPRCCLHGKDSIHFVSTQQVVTSSLCGRDCALTWLKRVREDGVTRNSINIWGFSMSSFSFMVAVNFHLGLGYAYLEALYLFLLFFNAKSSQEYP